jgi:hypothetical protein
MSKAPKRRPQSRPNRILDIAFLLTIPYQERFKAEKRVFSRCLECPQKAAQGQATTGFDQRLTLENSKI